MFLSSIGLMLVSLITVLGYCRLSNCVSCNGELLELSFIIIIDYIIEH